MPFLVETFDKPDSLALRQQHRPAHLDFLRENAAALLACGAKLSDDGETATGNPYRSRSLHRPGSLHQRRAAGRGAHQPLAQGDSGRQGVRLGALQGGLTGRLRPTANGLKNSLSLAKCHLNQRRSPPLQVHTSSNRFTEK